MFNLVALLSRLAKVHFMPQKLNNEGLLKVLGLMSGTSLDGLDLCLVEFSAKHRTQFQILASATYSYSKAWQEKLSFKQLSAWELSNLDYQYSLLLAQYVLRFCKEHGLETAEIDLLSSHGHTWFHQAEKGITYQIGNHPSLAVETGMELACDFRRQDVALGGQGAPLVPIGDRDLFPNYDACLNLGGFANISFQEDSKRIAYDIGPCNLAMNSYCQILGLPYDNEGTIAASFKHDSALFNKLNGLGYYIQSGPKSLGREWLEETLLPLVEETSLSPEVKIATLNRHIAFQIAASLNRHKLKKVLISGGGALNKTLIDSIGIWGEFDLVVAEAQILHFKEALIFAYLGYLHQHNKINVLSSVTGAKKDHCSGQKFHP